MCDYCQWIKEVKIVDPLCKNAKKLEKSKLEPIVIVHGNPSDVMTNDRALILNSIKKSLTEGYKRLIKGERAIDVVENTILQLEEEYLGHSENLLVKSTSLVDEKGRTGCVTGFPESCQIIKTRKLLEEDESVFIVEENTKGSVKEDEYFGKNSENSGCWCVIVRDEKGKFSCGRINWGFPDDSVPSISAATTIYGCGYIIRNQTCLSISGKDELIFMQTPARRLIRSIKIVNRHLCSKKEINKLMAEFKGENFGLVFLGEFNRPVVYSKKKFFPWGYCCRNMINYGASADELITEDVILNGGASCQCHWRYERHSPGI